MACGCAASLRRKWGGGKERTGTSAARVRATVRSAVGRRSKEKTEGVSVLVGSFGSESGLSVGDFEWVCGRVPR